MVNNNLIKKFLSTYILTLMFLAMFSILSVATVNADSSGSSENYIDDTEDNDYDSKGNGDKSKGNNGKSKGNSGESEDKEPKDNDDKPKGNGGNSKSSNDKPKGNNGKSKGNNDKPKGNNDKPKVNDDNSKDNNNDSEDNDGKRLFKWLDRDKDNKKTYEETSGSGSSYDSGTSGYSTFAVIGGQAFGTPGSYIPKGIDLSWMTITTFIALLTFILVVFLFKAKIIYLPR